MVLAAPVLLYVAQLSRMDKIGSLEDAFTGSAGHHLVVTNDIIDRLTTHENRFDLAAFFEQYMLLFLNWFPRSAWENKPIGAGLTSVDEIYGRQGFSDGHSISLGFIGEQIYLLGGYYFFGIAFLLITLIFLRRFVLNFSGQFIAPVVILDISLISYLWGGGASFGSRVWFMLIPAIITVVLLRNLPKKTT